MVAAMLLIVAVDVPFQLWQYHDKLKMSLQEVKQEGKELEGNPEVKGRIRQLQREAARKRMMGAVPTADVIVTNPTHFAVALAYKSGMGAPKVLAKGMGEVALKIREILAPRTGFRCSRRRLWRVRFTGMPISIRRSRRRCMRPSPRCWLTFISWPTGGRSVATIRMPPRAIAVPAELVPEALNG